MSDLNFQEFSTVQSKQQRGPTTIASTTIITPVSFMTLITGTTDIATVAPPVTGLVMLCLIFTDVAPGSLLTTGNILVGSTTITTDVPVLLFWDPNQQMYYCKA